MRRAVLLLVLLCSACASLPTSAERSLAAPIIDQRVIAGAAAQYTADYDATAAARTATQIPVDQSATAVREQWTAQAIARTQAADATAALIFAAQVSATVQALTPTVTRTPTASSTPTITPTPNATMTADAITAVAEIWDARVAESRANQSAAERGAQIATMFAGLAFVVVLALVVVPVLVGLRWVEHWRDELAQKKHIRAMQEREHIARLGQARTEASQQERTQTAAQERQASLDRENYLHWRAALRLFLQWMQALPLASQSRATMEREGIAKRDSWNKCMAVLQHLGALAVDRNGPATERRVLSEPATFERNLTPEALAAALVAAGEQLQFPPAVAAFGKDVARAIGEKHTNPTAPLSEVVGELVNSS